MIYTQLVQTKSIGQHTDMSLPIKYNIYIYETIMSKPVIDLTSQQSLLTNRYIYTTAIKP